jgi:UDP-3-O-[3-hydroxymyristoyl] glucosamine N-acyltransferase
VASGVYIGPKAEIGAGCILNTGAVIEHDVCIGDFSHVSVQATVAGYSRVGSRCMIGAGATVIDRVRIPDQTTIGAGATVIRDVPLAGTYVGCPARLVAHDTP